MLPNTYYDVFISFNSLDRKIASDVYSFLEQNGVVAFFSDESLKGVPGFVRKIDEAIICSKDFLLVTSSISHIMPASDNNLEGSDWVVGEIDKFIISNNNRAKKGQNRGKLVSFRTDSVPLEDMPLDFQRDSTAIVYTGSSSCWDNLLGCFQNLGKKETSFSQKQFLFDWLNSQRTELDELKMNLSNSIQVDRLTDVYVSLPINLAISINVDRQQVVSIADSNSPSSFSEIQNGKYASFRTRLNELISKGIEYRYQSPDCRPKILAPIWNNGIKKNYWVLNAIDVIASNNKTVVIGDPGLGKSTLLRYLAIELSNQYVSNDNIFRYTSLSDVFCNTKFIPVYIEIRDFIPWVGEQGISKYGIESVALYLCKKKLGKTYYYCEKGVSDVLKGKCVFLLDGLDEIASSDFNKNIICSIINDIERLSPMSKIVLSCRDRDYPAWDISGVMTVELQLMDRRTMYALAERIFHSHRSNADPNELFVQLDNMYVDEKLAGSPLFLSLMANLFLKGEGTFPKNKSTIIKESITLLLERKCNDLLSALNCSLKDVIETLEEIAYEMQSRDNGRGLKISRREMNGIIGDHMENCSLANSIKFFKATAGVIASQDSTEFEFTHRHFQEFLCASFLSKKGQKEVNEILKTGLLASPTKWSETCLLYIEILHDEDRKNDLWSLLYWLLKSIKGLSDTNQCWIVWFASEIIASRDYAILPQNDNDYDDRNDIVIDLVREAIKNVIEYNQTLPVEQKVECAETLGMIGDDRPGVNVLNEIPDHLWCKIDYEGKDFEMGVSEYIQRLIESQSYGNKRWGEATSFSREQPAKKISILPFYISKYETTNAQFLSFLDADDGYLNIKWWEWCGASTAFFQTHCESQYAKLKVETQKKKNCPVTHISFFEAVAYCKWLSTKLGTRVRLPTEGEWEYAARINGTIFAWGNQFDEINCNSSYSGIGDLTPVGIYHSNNDNHQPCEMNGNAWEWCQSIYPSWNSDEESLATYDEVNNFIDTDEYYYLDYDAMVAVRGGSFINPPALLRSTFRGRDRMGDSFYRQGFRVLKEIDKHPVSLPETISSDILAKNKEKAGAGKRISIGDKVRIAYKISKDGQVIQDNMLPEQAIEITVGSGELNEEIERYLLSIGASVATTVERDFDVCSVDKDGKTQTDKYGFFIFVSEIK